MNVVLLFNCVWLVWSAMTVVRLTTASNTYRQHSIRRHHSHHRTLRLGKLLELFIHLFFIHLQVRVHKIFAPKTETQNYEWSCTSCWRWDMISVLLRTVDGLVRLIRLAVTEHLQSLSPTPAATTIPSGAVITYSIRCTSVLTTKTHLFFRVQCSVTKAFSRCRLKIVSYSKKVHSHTIRVRRTAFQIALDLDYSLPP